MSERRPPLLPIFRSEQQLRLLGHLFVQAGHEYTIGDLAGTLGIPQQTVSREVAQLERAGLLATRTWGRLRLVRADEDGPYFEELRALLLKAVGPKAALAARLSGVAGVAEAYIFGSWASRYLGEEGPAPNDVDVVIVGEPDLDLVRAACLDAQAALGIDVDVSVLTPREWSRAGSGFVRQVKRGPLVQLVPDDVAA